MAHGDAQEGLWRGNCRMEWVASTLHTTSEHGVSSITTITTADAHTSAASSRLNWRPCRFKWTRPFRRKIKSVFRACAITVQKQSTTAAANDTLFWCRFCVAGVALPARGWAVVRLESSFTYIPVTGRWRHITNSRLFCESGYSDFLLNCQQ